MKQPAAYIMTNKKNGTLYIGVTSNLIQRIYQHKTGTTESFVAKYDCNKLVFYELFERMTDALDKERKLKKRLRKNKLKLIESKNPLWKDLYDDF